MDRSERQEKLAGQLAINPFSTDEELATQFGVSVQTIRLDRLSLGIPELRQRTLEMAQENGKVRSLSGHEIVGDLIDLELGKGGISVLQIGPQMVLTKSKVARGHYLFAQANSLAIAIIDAEDVLTGSARVRYRRPVFLNESVVAKASLKMHKGANSLVSITSKVKEEVVFKGQFIVTTLSKKPSPGGR